MTIGIFNTLAGEGDFCTSNARHSWVYIGNLFTADDTAPVIRNEFGTPLVRALFASAEVCLRAEDVIAYVNSDIILFPDFAEALGELDKTYEKFLMVGRRWNWHHPRPLQSGESRDGPMQAKLISEIKSTGRLFNAATDYFAFRPGMYDYELWPDLAIGRYWWDPWILWHTMQLGIPVIDATEAVFAVHQNHPVGHRSWDKEGQRNLELAKEAVEAGIDLDDVPYYMTEDLRVVKRDGL